MRTSLPAATVIVLTASMLIVSCSGVLGNDGGNGTGSTPAQVIDLTANSGDKKVNLSWFDPYASDLDHIEIVWKPEDGTSQPKIVSPGVESAAVKNLTNGSEYTFSVKAVYADGNTSAAATVSAPPADHSALFPRTAGAGLTGVWRSSVSLGDLDGDQNLDILVAGYDGSSAATDIYENKGSFSFKTVLSNMADVQFATSSLGDLDSDGDLDLVIAGRDDSGETAVIYENNGYFNFSSANAGLTGVKESSSSLGDVDGDGDLDLLLAGEHADSPTTTLYWNKGNLNFDAAGTSLKGIRRGSVSMGDVGSDGDLDILLTGLHDPQDDPENGIAQLYRNDGSGGLTAASAGLTAVSESSSNFGDVDNDGDLDLMIAGDDNLSNTTATMYVKEPPLGLTEKSAGLTGMVKASSSFGDVDRDGDLDLLLSGEKEDGSTVTTLYINDGEGNFSPAGAGLVNVHSGSCRFGDLDGDNDLDLVLTGKDDSGTARAVVYENQLF